jgi:hypothetical protein
MIAQTAIVAWLVSAMTAWSPPGREHFITEAQESKADAEVRYEAIAEALIKVAYNPNNTSLFGPGKYTKARTSLLLLSIGYFESGFRKDVDLGIGRYGRGDGGNSHCMLQIRVGTDRKSTSVLKNLIGQEWSADDLTSDRTKCFFTGYSLARKSISACRALPMEQRLAAYASGSCSKGMDKSEARVNKALKWYRLHVAPVTDSEVVAALFAPPPPVVVTPQDIKPAAFQQ